MYMCVCVCVKYVCRETCMIICLCVHEYMFEVMDGCRQTCMDKWI